MRSLALLAPTATLWLLQGCPAMAHAKDLCLVGGSVVDPVARTMKAADVVIKGATIARLTAPGVSHCQGTTVDVTGKFVVPGFVDAHVHAWGNPSPVQEDHDEEGGDENTAKTVLRTGVVAFLNMAGAAQDVALRDRLRNSSQHAQIVSAALTFSGAANDSEAREGIRDNNKTNPDLIKLFAGGGQIGAMVDEAKRLNKKTVVHISAWDQAREAVLAGATAITHLEDEATIPDDLVREMAERKTIAIPTMAVQCDMVLRAAWIDDPLWKAVTGPVLRRDYLDRTHFSAKTKRTLQWQGAGCKQHDFPSIRKLRAGGVRIIAGSDTGNLGTFQGFSLHREMQLLAEAGLSNWEALAAGTTEAAAFLNLRLGVAPGDQASLVILDASPLLDIRNTRRIVQVIHRGQIAR